MKGKGEMERGALLDSVQYLIHSGRVPVAGEGKSFQKKRDDDALDSQAIWIATH